MPARLSLTASLAISPTHGDLLTCLSNQRYRLQVLSREGNEHTLLRLELEGPVQLRREESVGYPVQARPQSPNAISAQDRDDDLIDAGLSILTYSVHALQNSQLLAFGAVLPTTCSTQPRSGQVAVDRPLDWVGHLTFRHKYPGRQSSQRSHKCGNFCKAF